MHQSNTVFMYNRTDSSTSSGWFCPYLPGGTPFIQSEFLQQGDAPGRRAKKVHSNKNYNNDHVPANVAESMTIKTTTMVLCHLELICPDRDIPW